MSDPAHHADVAKSSATDKECRTAVERRINSYGQLVPMLDDLRGLISQRRSVGRRQLWDNTKLFGGYLGRKRCAITGLPDVRQAYILVRPMHYQSPGDV